MPESTTNPLDYYAHHGPITDPGEHTALFDDLPSTIPALCEVVQDLMVHRSFADFYGLEVPEERKQEAELRQKTSLRADHLTERRTSQSCRTRIARKCLLPIQAVLSGIVLFPARRRKE